MILYAATRSHAGKRPAIYVKDGDQMLEQTCQPNQRVHEQQTHAPHARRMRQKSEQPIQNHLFHPLSLLIIRAATIACLGQSVECSWVRGK